MQNQESNQVSFSSSNEFRTYNPTTPPKSVSDRRKLGYWDHTYHNMGAAKEGLRKVVYKPKASPAK